MKKTNTKIKRTAWKLILCGLLVLSCLCAVACGAKAGEADSEQTGDETLVGIPWKPEDITENPALDGDSDEGMVSEGRLYFDSDSKTEALLVDSEGSLLWLYSFDHKEIFSFFDTGDLVRVGHGMIMETYPGQTYITKIALIEDGDVYSFTDEEWSRLSDIYTNPPQR
jgi:hypothetical protein